MFKTFLRITFLIVSFFSFKIKNHTKTCCDFYSFGNKNISQGIKLTTNGLKFYSNEEIFLFTWPFDEEKIYVVYGNIKPEEKHFVYGEVFWVQTIILKKTELEKFKKSLQYHIKQCYNNSPQREAVNTYYMNCDKNCKMKIYEENFVNNYFNEIKLEDAREYVRKRFFYSYPEKNIYKHKSKNTWDDFFKIIQWKFLDKKGKQIFSETDNKQYTYLYLLTTESILELGFNFENKILFLLEYDIINYYKHKLIYDQFNNIYEKNKQKFSTNKVHFDKILFEIPSKYLADNQKKGNIFFDKNDKKINQLWEDIVKTYNNENYNPEFYKNWKLL